MKELTKICSKCTKCLPLEGFSKQLKGKYGVTSICKECTKIRSKEWYNNNKEQRLEMCKEYTKANKQLIAEKSKKYRQANKDRLSASGKERYKRSKKNKQEYAKAYYLSNKDAYYIRGGKRRAAIKMAVPLWYYNEFETLLVEELYDKCSILSALTNKVFHVDHIVPIQSELVCGLHCFANLQILTAQQNISKSNRYWPDMP